MLTAAQQKRVEEAERTVGDKLTEAEEATSGFLGTVGNLFNPVAGAERGAVKMARELYNSWTTGQLKRNLLRGFNDNGTEYRLEDWLHFGETDLADALNTDLHLVQASDVGSTISHTLTDTVALDYVEEKASEVAEDLAAPWSFKTKAALVVGGGFVGLVALGWTASQFRRAAAIVGVG